MNLERLKEPFAPSDVSWRIGQAGKTSAGKVWAKVLAYIDNRNIQDRLDAAVGPGNWKNEYAKGPEGGVLCGLSIRMLDGEWVTKWDGAENSDIEPIKGGLSDSMKRAAVQWGIGRYLYDLGESWAEIVEKNTPGAHYAHSKIKVSGKEEWVDFYWLPPRNVLPGESKGKEPPKIEVPSGMTTGDKVPPPPKPITAATAKKGLKSIDSSQPNAAERLTKAEDLIYHSFKAGAINQAEKTELDFMVAEIQREIDSHKQPKEAAAA